MMIRFGTFLIIVLTAAGLAAQPKIDIPGNKFDFGMAPQGAVLVQYFWFRNPGTDTLHINRIVTGCDCATMPLTQQYIAPGDSMNVGLFWQTERKIGNTGRYPYIYTDASKDAARIFLTAQVLPSLDSARPVSFKPYKMELTKLPTMQVDSVAFLVTNHSTFPAVLKVITPPVEQCEVSIPDSLPSGSQGMGYVKVKPAYKDKEFENSFTVLVSSSAKDPTYRFTIPIRRKTYGK
ncbi:MAG TPA: DUF1573 domain-containing protein [Candidatus Acidoferrum sp.]|nr:DUF1573 domain-containing protein [Candidatus Acidoferrum sp.]